MSASKLFPYKIKEGAWYRANEVAESDIVVIVDAQNETIWYWEGTKSSARIRNNAREKLGQLKKKYVPYTFKRVSPNTPEPVLSKLEELREVSFKGKVPGIKFELSDFSKMFYLLFLIGSVLGLFCAFYMLTGLFWDLKTSNLTFPSYSVPLKTFTLFIDINSFILLVGLILLFVSAFFGGIIQRKTFALACIIAGGLFFMSFFILRIWDALIFYDTQESNLLIRQDVLMLFFLVQEVILFFSSVLALSSGVLGLKGMKPSILEKEAGEKTEETSEKKKEAKEKKTKSKKSTKK